MRQFVMVYPMQEPGDVIPHGEKIRIPIDIEVEPNDLTMQYKVRIPRQEYRIAVEACISSPKIEER